MAPALAGWLGNPALERYLPLLGIYLLLMLPSGSLEMVMVARKRYRWASWSFGTSDVLRVVALVVPALVWRRLDLLLVGAVVHAGARLCVALFYFRQEFRGALRPQAPLYREQLAYVLPFAVAVLVDTLQANYHQYAVSHRFDAATFAIYAVGCFHVPLLELVASPMCNVMMVRMAESLREGRAEAAREIWASTTRALALVFFPLLALLLVVASDLIVFLFTETYRASVPIFMIWSLSVALTVLQTDGGLRVFAATRFLVVLGALRLVLTAGLIGACMSLFGLVGAVLLTIAVAMVAKAVAVVRIKGLMGVGLRGLLPWRALGGTAAVAVVAAGPALAVRSTMGGSTFGRLALTGLVYAGSYLVLLFHSGILAEGEKQAVRERLQRWPLAAATGGSGS
jgi:O-antigen/teichoic acid export membrane protein